MQNQQRVAVGVTTLFLFVLLLASRPYELLQLRVALHINQVTVILEGQFLRLEHVTHEPLPKLSKKS